MGVPENLKRELSAEVDELIARGKEAEQAAHRGDARRAYEEALLALQPHDGTEQALSLLRWIGRTYLDDGKTEAAEDCFIAALAAAEAHDNHSARASSLNCIAVLNFVRGELEEAVPMFESARDIAETLCEMDLVAMIEQNLGAIAALRGESAKAIGHYQRSLDVYRKENLPQYEAPLLCNIGRLRTEVGDLKRADAVLTEAIEKCVELGDVSHEVLARVNKVRIQIELADWSRAAELCQATKDRAEQVGERRWDGVVLQHLGVIAREQGDVTGALSFLARAHEIAEGREDVVLQGEAAGELARIYRLQDRNRETLDALLKAHSVFRQVRADRQLADIDLRLAHFEETFLSIVSEWGESIDLKDPYTQGHCGRVAEYATALAESDGMDPKIMIWFRMGALLHDVGKVMIPDEVLNKPANLDGDEYDIVKQHPAAGETLIAGVQFPWDVLPMVRHHHERYDGAGYPDGLAGEDIPRPARILAIADVFDALTTTRAYRGALSLEEALHIMDGESGGAFDPQLYALFRELVDAEVVCPGSQPTEAEPTTC